MDQAQTKILRGTEELETMTPQMIEKRASEIARAEGRAEANDLDRTRAREELTGSTTSSEESRTVGEPDSDWYTPVGSSREKRSAVSPDDEETHSRETDSKRRRRS
jgi:hypothetical protein